MCTNLVDETRLLQQIRLDEGTCELKQPIRRELELHKLAESGRIVVSQCLGIPKGFQDGVLLDQTVVQRV